MIYFILFGVHMLLIGISTSVDSEDIMNTAALQTRPPSRFRWDHSWLTNHFHSYHIFHNGENTDRIYFQGKRHDFKAISKELSGKYISLVIPQQSDSEKMCQSERLMKLRNGYRLKRSHFTPHLSDVTLSGPRARLILFGGSNTTQFCGWHRRIQHSCYKFDYISLYWRWMK